MSSSPVTEGIVDGEEPVDDLDETLDVTPYVYSITAYGADYPVDSLVKRIDSGDIVVPRSAGNRTTDLRSQAFSVNTYGRGRSPIGL